MQVKIGSGKVAEPDFQRNGLLPELPNVQMRSGLTILSNPILRGKSSGNLAEKFRPQAALGTGVFPCKRVLTSKRYACPLMNQPGMG